MSENLQRTNNQARINYSVPIGTIIAHAALQAPSGYLQCDGSAVSRSTYAKLFSILGTTWGAGDGSTTFNIPDLRSATLRGVGTPTIFTSNDAVTLAQVINDKIQDHTHGVARSLQTLSGSANWVLTGNGNGDNVSSPPAPARTGTETTGKARGVYFLIKYDDVDSGFGSVYPYEVNTDRIDIPVTGTNWTTTIARVEVYKTRNGLWKARGNIIGVCSNPAGTIYTVALTGIIFKNIAGYYQSVSVDYDYSTTGFLGRVLPNTNQIQMQHVSINTSVRYDISFDVEIEKPNFI